MQIVKGRGERNRKWVEDFNFLAKTNVLRSTYRFERLHIDFFNFQCLKKSVHRPL